ncbi:hypothetical protein HPB50_020149 [Hyalomma asiaticum]|uniref:Uncharacterized protein n=1 Tax=Hyalomma asiaticum TaxID=266040 RepID=A0ACB7TQE0_HYAAI|nr:hypothetical protein HPB50_020149 [Hyalomma asiaticum]
MACGQRSTRAARRFERSSIGATTEQPKKHRQVLRRADVVLQRQLRALQLLGLAGAAHAPQFAFAACLRACERIDGHTSEARIRDSRLVFLFRWEPYTHGSTSDGAAAGHLSLLRRALWDNDSDRCPIAVRFGWKLEKR